MSKEQKIDPRICGVICECKGDEGEKQVQRCDKTRSRCGNYAAILALIEQEQKPMREALLAARHWLLYRGNDEIIEQIDAVLVEE